MNTFDFKVETYNGTDHLTWMSIGHFGYWFSDMEGSSNVAGFVADSSYNIKKKVMFKDGGIANMHEFSVVDGGKSAIITMEKVQQKDVSSLTSKYPDGLRTLITGFQEIDLGTGRMKFEWLPTDHGVTVDESFFLQGLDDDSVRWDFW